MPLVNSFHHYSPLADSTETISRLDRIACYLHFFYIENIHLGIIKQTIHITEIVTKRNGFQTDLLRPCNVQKLNTILPHTLFVEI